jgi:hypothetical protein
LSGLIMAANGELVLHEFKGPPDYEHWKACWDVFQSAMIMLKACNPAYLIAYADFIGRYAKRYGQKCWALIYQTETRFRREVMERMRRRASNELDRAIIRGFTTEFDPSRPWEYTFQHAEDEVKYWHPELEEPALIAISGNRSSQGFVDSDAHISESSGSHITTCGAPSMALSWDGSGGARQSQQDRRPPAKHQPPKRAALAITDMPPKVKKVHNVENGKYTTNRGGHSLCLSFNAGACGLPGNVVCPKDSDRRHNCNLCLSADHGAQNCTKTAPAAKGKGGKGGKGRGKNK